MGLFWASLDLATLFSYASDTTIDDYDNDDVDAATDGDDDDYNYELSDN